MAGTAVAVVGLVVSVYSSEQQASAQKKAAQKQEENQRRLLSEQEKMRAEQQASNAEKAARERRQQIREERVRRAKIMQASENTGVSGSSGELGSIAGLGTQLGSNLGANASSLSHAANINTNASAIGGIEQQMLSDNLNLQQDLMKWGQVGQIGGAMTSLGSMGMSAGGAAKPKTQAPAPYVDMSTAWSGTR